MSQRRLLPLLLLLISIESVKSRALSSDDWQRLAGTGADVRSDAILPCVESGSCRGREFGSMSEDVSKFGNVPPCRFHGWVRCIQSAGPSIRDAAHGRQYHQSVATPQYFHQKQNKDSLAQQSSSYSSQAPRSSAHQSTGEYGLHPSGKAAGQERRNERLGFVSANTQRSLGHEQQQERRQPSLWQPKDEREMQEERRSALLLAHSAVVEIPKGAEWQGNHLMQGGAAVQFQQHSDSAAAADVVLLPSVDKQPAELWGIQAGAQRSPSPESQGLTQPIQRPVEFQHPHQPFEQSSQQLSIPSKFTQQQQLIQNELPGKNFVEPPPFSSQQSLNKQQQQQQQQPAGQFRQLNTQPGQETFKTSSAVQHRPDIGGQQFGGQQFVAEPRPFVKVNAMPAESQRLTSGTFFQQVPPRVEQIPSHSNPSFRLIEAGQQIIDPRRLVEPPPQRGAFEPQQQQQQRFVRVNQPVTDPIKKEEPKQFASSQSNRQPQTLPQANQPLVQLQQQSARPLVGQQPIIADNHLRINQQHGPVLQTGPLQQRPVEPQRSAEPRKLDPRPLVKSNSLGESPQFIEPAKSSLGNLFEFDSSTDTQLAREQLAELIRLLAQSASQQQTDSNREATPNPSAPASSRQGESSNILPFIAFSEPLPLEPASSNSLF